MKNRLKETREYKNLSQQELSEKAEVSRATISGIESGRVSVVTTSTLSKIATALECKITDIFF